MINADWIKDFYSVVSLSFRWVFRERDWNLIELFLLFSELALRSPHGAIVNMNPSTTFQFRFCLPLKSRLIELLLGHLFLSLFSRILNNSAIWLTPPRRIQLNDVVECTKLKQKTGKKKNINYDNFRLRASDATRNALLTRKSFISFFFLRPKLFEHVFKRTRLCLI